MNSPADRSPAIITHGVAVNFAQARELMEREIRVATEAIKTNPTDTETLISAYNSIHVGKKLQVIFLSGELRKSFVEYVRQLLEALVSADRKDVASEILVRYSKTGTGNLHPIDKFWKE